MSENTEHGRITSGLFLVYGAVAYLGFQGVFVYMILFMNGAIVPRSVEGAATLSTGEAIAVNAALAGLFALQHTVMARPRFKRAWTRIVPPALERSTFVIVTVACLAVIMGCWQPIEGGLYSIEAPAARIALYAVQAAGWGILVWSTFLIDHFELFGLKQVFHAATGRALPQQQFRKPSLYRLCRHPMMLGMVIGLWATPDMSAGRLCFAALMTGYLLLGIRIEERDLVAQLGSSYRHYQQEVPRLLPRLPRRSQPSPQRVGG